VFGANVVLVVVVGGATVVVVDSVRVFSAISG
jgi:hypothetical protein